MSSFGAGIMIGAGILVVVVSFTKRPQAGFLLTMAGWWMAGLGIVLLGMVAK